jgi:hypothetical protein
MSTISASTLTTTALVYTADTTGALVFKTGATPTTALTLGADQSATFAGTVNFGTAGFTNLSVTGIATFSAGTVSLPSITTAGDTNTGIFFPAADTIAFTEGGTEAMRIDSAGDVGIGTSTPASDLFSKFTVQGSAITAATSGEANGVGAIRIVGSPSALSDVNSGLEFKVAGDTNGYGTKIVAISSGGSNLVFATRSASATWSEQMRLTAAGQFGIGPSATNRLNFTYDGGSGIATIGPNSTGGSTILTFGTSLSATYAERMRISSSGNLLVGSTSDNGYRLKVVGGNATDLLVDNDGSQFTQILLQRNATANTGGDILIDGTNSQFQIRGLLAGPMIFQTSASAGSPVERMRIDSSGNVGIGTTPVTGTTTALLQVGGGILIPGNNLGLATNLYYASVGGWKYSTNGSGGYILMSRSSTVGIEFGYATNNTSGAGAAASPVVAMSINTNGAISLQGAVTTASGVGITFPATQSASSDANTLDDYEEGTWTPTLNFNGSSTGITYGTQVGNYTKIGNTVRLFATLALTSKGSASGVVGMAGAPFSTSDSGYAVSAIYGSLQSVGSQIIPYISGTSITFEVINTGTQSGLLNTNVQNSSTFYINVTYKTNS